MKAYTILSYNFGDYDILREPLVVDPNAEYIYVTDHEVESSSWSVFVDQDLAQRNPVYAAYYVRYHPFKYANTPVVFVIDASIQLQDSLADIYHVFNESSAVYMPMMTNHYSDERKLDRWVNEIHRMDEATRDMYLRFISRCKLANQRGSIGMAFSGYKKGNAVLNRYLKHSWRILTALGTDGAPLRLDEIVAHKVLTKYDIPMMPVSLQIIQSSYMMYCTHRLHRANPILVNYDQIYYLCGKPYSPYRFDKRYNFQEHSIYHTEAMLLTKYLTADDLDEWLDYHLNKVRFDRVHIFDNESAYDVKSVIEKYGDRITYELVKGHPRQYALYDRYINQESAAEWVMPIDDDEFLDIGDFDSVYDAIEYYRNKLPHLMILGVRWKHVFPKKFHSERTGKVLDYCTESNPELAKSFMWLGDTAIKCIIRRYGKVHYEETWENPAGGHVPKHTCFLGAAMCDGRGVTGCGIPDCPDVLEDERIRLLHCRYKGYSDWTKKYCNADNEKNCRTVCDSSVRDKNFKFNKLLKDLD